MSGNSTSLYTAVSSSNGTTTSNNFTTLYPNAQGVIVPTTPYGNANVVSLLAAGSDGGNTISNIIAAGNVYSGNVSATGNIYAQNVFANIVGNLVVPGSSGQVLFNTAGEANASAGLTFSTSSNVLSATGGVSTPVVFGQGLATQGYDYVQMQYSNALALPVSQYDIGTGSWFYLDAGGGTFQSNTTGTLQTIVQGNDGSVSATGNVTGNYIFGNGSQLTGLPAGNYSNANVVSLMANFGSNVIVTTGNITGGYFQGNGSQLTGLPATYGNANVVANLAALGSNPVSTTGNVSAGYFFGNGSQLTGLPATYSNANVATFLADFGSNTISTTGNVTASYYSGNGSQLTGIVSDYGNSNVATYLASGTNTQDIITQGTVQGNLLQTPGASGNIVGVNFMSANFYLGNGSLLTGVVATSVGILPTLSVTGNTTTGNLLTGGVVSATGNITGGNLNTGGGVYVGSVVSAVGNVRGGNINTDGIVTATGNVYGNYFVGNGSQLTGIVSSYGNANVVANLAALGSNPVSTTGNITAGYFVGNGSLLTTISGGNVTGPVANATYATTAGSATTAGTVTANAQANITSVGVLTSLSVSGNSTSGNLLTAGLISATGNVTGNFFVGNGSALTGIVATSVGTLASLSVTGNIDTGNLRTAGQVSATGNITGANLTIANISATGRIDVIGNGQIGNIFTAGVVSATGNVRGGNLQALAGNVTATGQLSAGGNVIGGNIITGGLISATGNINVANIMSAANILLGTSAGASGGNVIVEGATGQGNIQLNPRSASGGQWVNIAGNLSVTGNVTGGNITTVGLVSATGNVTGNFFIGNGSQLTGIAASYGNANVSNFLANFGSNSISTSGNVTAGYFVGNGSLLSSITGGNVTGTVANATYATTAGTATTATTAGTVTSNAQANITSVGVLTSLSVSGNTQSGNLLTAGVVSATGNITGNYFIGNGSALTGISAGGSPGGANTQIQYNNASAFAGNANLTFNNTTGNVNLGNLIFTTSNAVNYINTVATNTGVPANVFSLNSSQIVIGNTYNGNANLNNQGFAPARGAKFQVWDTFNVSDSGGPRYSGITSTPYAILAGNISNNNTTLRAAGALMTVGGNSSNYTFNVNGLFGITGGSFAASVGQPNTTVAVGNTTVGNVAGLGGSITVNLGSTANNAMQLVSAGTYNGPNATGNVGGLVFNLASNFGNSPANVFGIYMTGNNSSGGGSTGMFGAAQNADGIRNAANYYFLYNNDTLAQNKIGSLSSFNEFRYDGANTSGTLAVDKNNGQVQNVYLTGAITSVTFSNFVTSAATNTTTKYQTDTVTLILHQGTTPYAVTMPTGTAYKYAAGSSTVGATANAVTMISVTATYDSITSADQYLITISPEFT